MQPIVLDNYLDSSYVDGIESRCTGEQIPWSFLKNITFEKKSSLPPKRGFVYTIFRKENTTNLYFYLLPFFEQITKKLKFNNVDLLRIRLGLNIPNNIEQKIDTPHVDFNFEHFTMLYYVNDATGPTNLYKEFFSLDNTQQDLTKLKISQQIEPKKGRILIFDGLQYHSSSTPDNDIRLVLNFNFCADLESQNYKLNFY